MDAARSHTEWLEPDGLGGFASGTSALWRTRRYHALLLAATQPPAGRMVLVNGAEVSVATSTGSHPLSSQRYVPDVIHPQGFARVESFRWQPWPTWVFVLADGTRIQHELLVRHEAPVTVLSWRRLQGTGSANLSVRPLLSGRDVHATHHENPAFRFEPVSLAASTGCVGWKPYPDVVGTWALHNGSYHHAPLWFRGFQYDEERARGLDFVEDLASPGELRFDLAAGEAVLLLCADLPQGRAIAESADAAGVAALLREAELRRREAFPTPLHRAADAYLVRRGSGRTIVAGYPWFTDWGRDTFIALRGLCLATGRIDDAYDILGAWSGAVSEGMLPNLFVEQGGQPEYNSVDASLWYVIAVHETLRELARRRSGRRGRRRTEDDTALRAAALAIVEGYASGTRYGIRMEADGLLAAGQPGVQLTWMDAKIGDWVVTPRIGKPVEVQALWLNALRIAAQWDARWEAPLQRGLRAFADGFWNAPRGCLYDVVDVDHQQGRCDASLRPNQILAIGGLPWPVLHGDAARRVVDTVERELWTPYGLRSLAPGEPGYAPVYEGDMRARDAAYHQGTVWPWLAGPFVEAWVRVRGGTSDARDEARGRFVQPLLDRLQQAGLGHLCEIADADPPHAARGCPFQAWSVGELARLSLRVLALQDARSQAGG